MILKNWDQNQSYIMILGIFLKVNNILFLKKTICSPGCPRMITVTPDDSRYIIAISKERTYFRMLDLVEKKEVDSLFSKVHESIWLSCMGFWKTFIIGEICCVTVTPDSKFIVFGSPDKSIKLFEIATKEISDPFKEHLQGKISFVFWN